MKLPKDTFEIEYGKCSARDWNKRARKNEKAVVTTLRYDCGCEWEIVWSDIERGSTYEMYNLILCEEHDPTLPFIENEEE